jgi:hypothetical protein
LPIRLWDTTKWLTQPRFGAKQGWRHATSNDTADDGITENHHTLD